MTWSLRLDRWWSVYRATSRGSPAVGTPRTRGPLTPAQVRRGFRNLRAKTARPAGAPKPTTPDPGRPPGLRNRQPATRHDVARPPNGHAASKNTKAAQVKERAKAGFLVSRVSRLGGRGPRRRRVLRAAGPCDGGRALRSATRTGPPGTRSTPRSGRSPDPQARPGKSRSLSPASHPWSPPRRDRPRCTQAARAVSTSLD
jgi:hypothetical protein